MLMGSLSSKLKLQQLKVLTEDVDSGVDSTAGGIINSADFALQLPTQCRKSRWFDESTSYQKHYKQVLKYGIISSPDLNQLVVENVLFYHFRFNEKSSESDDKASNASNFFSGDDQNLFAEPSIQSFMCEQMQRTLKPILDRTSDTQSVSDLVLPLLTNLTLLPREAIRRQIEFSNRRNIYLSQQHRHVSPAMWKQRNDSDKTFSLYSNSVKPKKAAGSSLSNSQPLQTVEVPLGHLGTFTVRVYSDGFHVYSHLQGNSLEISSVGQPVVFAREFENVIKLESTQNTGESNLVVGDITGNVTRCYVSAIDLLGNMLWKR